MSTTPMECGDPSPPSAASHAQREFEIEALSTPRSRSSTRWASQRGVSPSSPGADDSGSPERTPGPGEGSPVGMDAQGEDDENGEDENCDVAGVVAEAEERSIRRAAAIRGVLEQLRVHPGSMVASPTTFDEVPPLPTSARVGASDDFADDEEEEPMPQPRAHPLPIPAPVPFMGGLGRQRTPVAVAKGELQQQNCSATDHKPPAALPSANALEERRLLKHCGALEERLEKHQSVLDRTMGSLESEQQIAQEAHESLFKAEAEIAYAEGMAARKEAELRTELMDIRSECQRERERLRSEARRMQMSMKDLQGRVKTEVQARTGAAEQVDSLKEQLNKAAVDLQRRGREGQEAKAAFATLEKRLEQHTEFFTWLSMRCHEALGEDFAQEAQREGHRGDDAGVEGLKRIVVRTLTLLQRRASSDTDCDKENVGKNGKGGANRANPHLKSKQESESAQRLVSVQQELLNAEVANEELVSRQRNLQERLSESEEQQAANIKSGLRTEQRGRLRAAEEGQKRLQKQLVQLQEELQWQYARHEEEHERMRSKHSALQRAKEAGERYIEAEEDAWINAQRQERALQSEHARMLSEIHDAEANAREATADAVEARTASQMAAAATRRLEADLEELQVSEAKLMTGRGATRDHSISLATRLQLETEVVERLRGEVAVLRQESCSAQCQCKADREHEREPLMQKIIVEERNAGQWYETAEMACQDRDELQRTLDEHIQAFQTAQQQFQIAMENQQVQQSKIDEKKRVMINNAMEEQEQTLRREFSFAEASLQTRCEEAIRELHSCADEHQEQKLQLDYANRSLAFHEQRLAHLETELQQQVLDLSHQEQQICDFGRAELMAMTEQQETRLKTEAEKNAQIHTEQLVADAVASIERKHNAAMAHCRGCHAAALAAVHGEYSGEVAALRQLESTSRDELANARLACEAAEAAVEETARLEAEKARSAERALRHEQTAFRQNGEKLRKELREQLREELWTESCTKVRQEIVADVRGNPCNQLRKELSHDLRCELADQVRAELRSEIRNELQASNSGIHGSPSSSASRRRRQHRTHSATACSTSASGIVAGVSPSSIGACSPGEFSPGCASSMLLLPGSSSPGLWPETGDLTSRELLTSCTLTATADTDYKLGVHPFEETSSSTKPPGVASAPVSRQSSVSVLDFAVPAPAPPPGVVRQCTAPAFTSNSKLDGMLPPPPQHPATAFPDFGQFGALPPPPDPVSDTSSLQNARSNPIVNNVSSKISALPHPPPGPPPQTSATSFEGQASAVLAMVSRSRAPFRARGFPLQGRAADQSLGSLPSWPGSL